MTKPIHVFSEIGELQTVMLKRPGKEVENLTPDTMERLLFDDIPYLPIIQKEHDAFAQTLRDNGTEVLYLEDLVAEAIDAGDNKAEFVKKMLSESNLNSKEIYSELYDYLMGMSTADMIEKMMSGVRKNEVKVDGHDLATIAEESDYPFYMDPMPNLYFTRDPAASMGDGLTINRMTFAARQRESMFMEEIMNHHPRFANQGDEVWRNRDHSTRIEGGDELILSDKVVAIGISQRTSANAIEEVAEALFNDNSGFEKVVAVKIPKSHATMHLDTVFTMIDYDKFTVFPGIMGEDSKMDIYILESDKKGGINISHRDNLEKTLKEVLNLSSIDLIETGNADPIVAPREQWNDGSNTLAIAPGVVVTYDRNYVSNELLRQHGIKVIEVPSSELSRGRGGPRCMSMPLVRKDLKK